MQLRQTISSTLALALLAGSAAGAAAQDDEARAGVPAPIYLSFGGEPEVREGTTDDPSPGRITVTGIVQTGEEIGATDARLAGGGTTVMSGTTLGDPESAAPPFGDDMSAPPPELLTVATVARRIVNDGGAWSGSGYEVEYQPEGDGGPVISGFEILVGEGDYAGLTLILTSTGEQQLGWIVPSDALQPVPDIPAE